MVQSIKHPTLDLSSGHDVTVPEFEPMLSYALMVLSLLRILVLLSAPPLPVLAFSITEQ